MSIVTMSLFKELLGNFRLPKVSVNKNQLNVKYEDLCSTYLKVNLESQILFGTRGKNIFLT